MKRNCYCKKDQKFCGKCDDCGKPGHVSHAPAGIPCTGCWCDSCFEKITIREETARQENKRGN